MLISLCQIFDAVFAIKLKRNVSSFKIANYFFCFSVERISKYRISIAAKVFPGKKRRNVNFLIYLEPKFHRIFYYPEKGRNKLYARQKSDQTYQTYAPTFLGFSARLCLLAKTQTVILLPFQAAFLKQTRETALEVISGGNPEVIMR